MLCYPCATRGSNDRPLPLAGAAPPDCVSSTCAKPPRRSRQTPYPAAAMTLGERPAHPSHGQWLGSHASASHHVAPGRRNWATNGGTARLGVTVRAPQRCITALRASAPRCAADCICVALVGAQMPRPFAGSTRWRRPARVDDYLYLGTNQHPLREASRLRAIRGRPRATRFPTVVPFPVGKLVLELAPRVVERLVESPRGTVDAGR